LSRVFKFASDVEPMFDEGWRDKIAFVQPDDASNKIRRATHQAIQKATEDIDRFAFNTYVSALMTYLNALSDSLRESKEPSESSKLAFSEGLESLILILAPSVPHSADELWESLGKSGFTYEQDWPKWDPLLAKEDTVTIAVQVNGKLRDTIEMPAESTNEELEKAALSSSKVQAILNGNTIRKVIIVPGKLVNVVAN